MPDMANGPEFEALLAVEVESPNDRAPRLILADWLEERGDDAGAAIRWAAHAVREGDTTLRPWQIIESSRHSWCFPFGPGDICTHARSALDRELFDCLDPAAAMSDSARGYPTAEAAWLDLLEAWRRCPFAKRPRHGGTPVA